MCTPLSQSVPVELPTLGSCGHPVTGALVIATAHNIYDHHRSRMRWMFIGSLARLTVSIQTCCNMLVLKTLEPGDVSDNINLVFSAIM